MSSTHPFKANRYITTLLQASLPLLLLWLARFVFAAYNGDSVGNPSAAHVMSLAMRSWAFDLLPWAYANGLFLLMRFMPFDFTAKKWWEVLTRIIYVIPNALMLLAAYGDIPYFRFTGARMRWSNLTDLFTDPNIGGIMTSYIGDYWWTYLTGLLIIGILIFVALIPVSARQITFSRRWLTAAVRAAIIIIVLCVVSLAMRGRAGAGKPISIGDAVFVTDKAPETNIVLNTPFTLLRSMKGDNRVEPLTFFTERELGTIRSSIHRPDVGTEPNGRNIMVIVIESGAQLWLDNLNNVEVDTARNLMPFLDSLATQSVVCRNVFTTGRRSIEGITAIFGGFPTFGEMLYMPSPYSGNVVDAFPRLLGEAGYDSRFYYGGNHGSFNIDQLVKAMGFKDVADRDTYGNDKDFDGTWGIFDHAMARYAANDLTTLKEPFVAGWFTLNLHGPYEVPSYWNADGYRHKEKGVERSAEYTDRSVREFFEVARKQPWYGNTTFVITGDHGCRELKGTKYDTPYIQSHVMFMIYAPDGSLPPDTLDVTGSQIDISPTILSLTGYADPYVGLGTDLRSPEAGNNIALFYQNCTFYVYGRDYTLQLDPKLSQLMAVYDHHQDPELKTPLKTYDTEAVTDMLLRAQALYQDYADRLSNDKMTLHQ